MTHGWWDFGVSRAWPAGSAPAAIWWTMQDLLMRQDATESLRTAGAVVMLADTKTEWSTLIRCAAALREADARALVIVPPSMLADASARLAGEGFVIAPATIDASATAGVLSGLVAARESQTRLQQELEIANRSQNIARRWIRRVDDEMHLAARMQRDLLPRSMPHVGSCKTAALFRPLWHVSGDVYRCWRLDEQRIGFMIADAMGHGVRAAMATMILAHELVLKEVTPDGYRLIDPTDALTRLNSAMMEHDSESMRFASALCGVIDTTTGATTLAGAGHPHPVVVDATGAHTIEMDGPILGVFDEAHFAQTHFTLQPGATLCIYTDGAEEALAKPGSGEDGARCVRDALARSVTAGASDLATITEVFNAELNAAPGSLHRNDDITLLMIRRD